jgi:hypothetical protein
VSARLAPASCISELVFHGLSWLAVAEHPASLFDPRYHRFAREQLEPECNVLFEEDGALLGARFVARDLVLWHALPTAFESPSELRSFAKSLTLANPARRRLVAECLRRDAEATEWFALDLAYASRAFERGYASVLRPMTERGCEALAPALERAMRIDPALARFEIALSAVLGGRGRALDGDRLFTGAVTPWSDHDATHSAVQLLHERAVRGAGDVDYVCAEWTALVELAKRVEGTELEQAHAAWVARHELRSLIEQAIARGYASRAECEGIAFGSRRGAARLRACRTPCE